MSNESPRWIEGSIEGQHGRPRGEVDPELAWRGLDEYLRAFDLKIEDIEGNIILDLGCGPTAQLAQDLRDRAEVWSMSPDFAQEEYREKLPKDLPVVAGLGQEMPFRDNFFDRVFVFHVTEWVNDEELRDILSEAVRVVRSGGTIHVLPTDTISNNLNEDSLLTEEARLYAAVELRDTGRTVRTHDDLGYGHTETLYEVIIRKHTAALENMRGRIEK